MKIVIDSNIVFSILLNSNSKLAEIFFKENSGLDFLAPILLLEEIETDWAKIIILFKSNKDQLYPIIELIASQIEFISYEDIINHLRFNNFDKVLSTSDLKKLIL